jgi:hypothetical protein
VVTVNKKQVNKEKSHQRYSLKIVAFLNKRSGCARRH